MNFSAIKLLTFILVIFPGLAVSNAQEAQSNENLVVLESNSDVPNFSTPTIYASFNDNLKSEFTKAVEQEFNAASKKAGISVAVYTKDKLWVYSQGIADSTTEMTINTPILIGSTSKTLVSSLILMQIEQGLYNIDSSLESVLSGHPDYSTFDKNIINPKVTIEELLSMKSGLPNYNDNRKGLTGLFKSSSWKPSQNIQLNKSPYVKPGVFDYNDTNLALLGLIAEYHGGNDLYSLYKQTFFDKLDLTLVPLSSSTIRMNPAMPYDNLRPWAEGFGNLIEAAPFTFEYWIKGQSRMRWACCWLVSTPANLSRWGYELYSGKGNAIPASVRKQLLNSMKGNGVTFQGTRQKYGYFVTERMLTLPSSRTITTYGHPGGGGGYSTLLRYSPELDLAIAILVNSTLKFQGSCKKYDPRTCIAESIFAAYSK